MEALVITTRYKILAVCCIYSKSFGLFKSSQLDLFFDFLMNLSCYGFEIGKPFVLLVSNFEDMTDFQLFVLSVSASVLQLLIFAMEISWNRLFDSQRYGSFFMLSRVECSEAYQCNLCLKCMFEQWKAAIEETWFLAKFWKSGKIRSSFWTFEWTLWVAIRSGEMNEKFEMISWGQFQRQ